MAANGRRRTQLVLYNVGAENHAPAMNGLTPVVLVWTCSIVTSLPNIRLMNEGWTWLAAMIPWL